MPAREADEKRSIDEGREIQASSCAINKMGIGNEGCHTEMVRGDC